MSKKKSKKKTVKKATPEKPVVKVNLGPEITPYPQAGRKVLEFEDNLDRQLSGDMPSDKKRGPGRPPGPQKVAEPEPPDLSIEVVAGVVKIPFELWAISQSIEKLALDDKEAEQIAEPARQLLEYYLPKIPVIAYAWVSMSVSVFWVMRSRLFLIAELRKQKEAKKPTRPAEPSQPGVIVKFPAIVEPEKV